MHYYKRNIGDYHKKAGRLTMLQHGAYTLLMDACYDREKFPTKEDAIEWLWANTQEEIAAIDFVLKKFFTEIDGVFVQHRIESELSNYAKNAETNKRIALEREEKRRLKSTKRAQSVDDSNTERHLTTNQEPLTTNQELDKDTRGDESPKQEAAFSAKSDIRPSLVKDLYNDMFPELSAWRAANSKRETRLRTFIKSRQKDVGQFNMAELESYFIYIKNNCQWMLEKQNGYNAKNIDFFLSEKCWAGVYEGTYKADQ